MSGSIWQDRKSGRWVVGFWHKGRQHKIWRYRGVPMRDQREANKCLAMIQGRKEQADQGLCDFRIEEFTGKGWTDVIEYYEEWLDNVIDPNRKPATSKGYRSYLRKWIKPFFAANPVPLHEVQLDTLTALLNHLKKSGMAGKGALNVMMALRSMMDYAWRSKRIPEIPPFPKREDYGIVEPTINWLPEDRQMKIINAIPEIHRPIFLWLKYHYRRPAEACALRWEDYDAINGVFIVRRSISARKKVESTKTGNEHIVPCHPRFVGVIRELRPRIGEVVFQNPRARRSSKRYTSESLNNIWRKACTSVGENIDLYSGLKHSSCSQWINEVGGNIHELQVLTDHKRLDSVRKYAKIEMSRKRALMDRTTRKLPALKVVGKENE